MFIDERLTVTASIYAEKQEELNDISREEKIDGITHDSLERRDKVMKQLVALNHAISNIHEQIQHIKAYQAH